MVRSGGLFSKIFAGCTSAWDIDGVDDNCSLSGSIIYAVIDAVHGLPHHLAIVLPLQGLIDVWEECICGTWKSFLSQVFSCRMAGQLCKNASRNNWQRGDDGTMRQEGGDGEALLRKDAVEVCTLYMLKKRTFLVRQGRAIIVVSWTTIYIGQ